MKFLYSMILLMAVMSVNASEKKLKARLEREYDLQLTQKQKEIESRKLLQSVAKKQKSNVRDDRQKNSENNKKLEIKQQQKWQRREEEALIKWKKEYARRRICETVTFAFLTSASFPIVLFVMGSMFEGVPIGCYNSGSVCKCLGM